MADRPTRISPLSHISPSGANAFQDDPTYAIPRFLPGAEPILPDEFGVG